MCLEKKTEQLINSYVEFKLDLNGASTEQMSRIFRIMNQRSVPELKTILAGEWIKLKDETTTDK